MKLADKSTLENPARYEIVSLFRGSLLSYMVGFYIFAFYLELHFRIPELQSIRFQFTYGALVGAYCLFKFLTDNKKSPNLEPVTKTALWLIFILGFYTVFSMDREESVRVFSDRVVKFALVSFFIYAATEKVEDLRVIIAFMLLAWLKIGQEGFWGWFTGNLVWENQGIPRLHGSTAMFGHPNSFSGFAVGCLPFAVFLFLGTKSKLLKLGLLALFACALIIVVTTGSRTGYVAVILGAIYFFMKLKAGKIKIIFLALTTFLLTINFVPIEYKERFQSIFTGEEKEGNSSGKRKEILADAIQIYLANPFGVGVAAFPKAREQTFGGTQDTHNLYLEVLTNTGTIGFIVFCLFIKNLIYLPKKLIPKIPELGLPEEDKKFILSLTRATIGFILLRLLLGLFGMDLYEIYWWIALGFCLAIKKLTHRSELEAAKK